MAIRDEIITSLVEAIAGLNQRVANAESAKMIQGPQGERGPAGADGNDAPPITDEQIKAQAVAWLADNITQPKDGEQGPAGKDGQDGRPPTADEIRLAVDVWFEINRDELRGADGENGRDGNDGANGVDGRNGRDGRDGIDGTDGVSIALVEQRDETSFWITLSDGQETEIELPKSKGGFYIGGGGGGGTFDGIDLGTY